MTTASTIQGGEYIFMADTVWEGTKKDLKQCKICNNITNVVFNIKFKAVPICEDCACAITKQQVIWLCNGGYK